MSLVPCGGCLLVLSESLFSSTQLKKSTPRCKLCIERHVNVSPEASAFVLSAGFRQCEGDKKLLHFNKFSSTQASRCIDCEKKKAGEEAYRLAEEKNARNRTKAAGACQVKDVCRFYGDVCETPLQAYQEAGVAHGWKDWVTKQDVDQASDAFDARGIAHDIETQWGSIPGGGAYKDSNHYYGPGIYDYY